MLIGQKRQQPCAHLELNGLQLGQPLKRNAVTSACVGAMAVYLDSVCCRQYARDDWPEIIG